MAPRARCATVRGMDYDLFWALIAYAFVVLTVAAVIGGGWRMFHPHDRYR